MIGADVDPSNGLGERRGVSPPVLHPTASPTKFEVPTGGLTPNACNMRVVFPETVALERQVCHCFGVLAEAVLLTLRGPNDGSGWGALLVPKRTSSGTS